MSTSTKAKIMVAIFAASMLVQSMNAISLTLQGIADTYDGTTVAAAQLIISVTNLVALVSMLIAGKVVCYITKKVVLLILILLIAVGALVAYFATPTLIMVYVACGIIGLGTGGLIPIVSALIGEYFDGAARATVMGVQGLFVNGGGMIIQLVGGFLAATYWKNLFLMFLASLAIALIVLILLPKGTVEAPEVKGEKVKIFTPFLGIMMFQGFFTGFCMMVFMSNITFYVFDLGIGNEAQAGLITMAFSGGAVVFGILIALIMKLFKKYIFAVGLTCGAVSLWLFALTGNFIVFVVAAILAGVSFTLHNTSYYSLAPANCNPAAMTMTMSLYTVAMQAGMIICPIIVTPLAAALGGSFSMSFMIGAVAVSVVAIIAYFTPRAMKNAKLTID